jgi:hypothetical protein
MLFGEVIDPDIRLNEMGMIVQQTWTDLPRHYRGIDLDAPQSLSGIITPFSISAFPSCFPILRWPAATVATPASSARSAVCSYSSSTIGASNCSMPLHVTRFLRNAMAADRRSSPAKYPSTNGWGGRTRTSEWRLEKRI